MNPLHCKSNKTEHVLTFHQQRLVNNWTSVGRPLFIATVAQSAHMFYLHTLFPEGKLQYPDGNKGEKVNRREKHFSPIGRKQSLYFRLN